MENFLKTKVFTDGGCIGNPGPGGWAAIVLRGEYYEEFGGSEPETTNNRMEMRAALEGLGLLAPGEAAVVITDSRYLIDGITKWIHGWKRKGWRKSDGAEVLNRDLWEALDKAAEGKPLEWRHIAGHSGHPENERCDKIANTFARGGEVELKKGDGSWIYSSMPVADEVYEKPLYLSEVKGDIREHKSWPECEARIKGVKGSRCKKVKTKGEHIATIAAWGDDK
ncbi:MAG: ribonuclease HI [Deltaproteobacteria bacterium]|nr:MAG: ribonuclease HI [Deltaproteobacteria bacterium]